MILRGRTALVTGAASGIGRAVARSLGKRGCALALCDVDETGLRETAQGIGTSVRVTTHRLDVTDRGAVAALPDAVRRDHAGLDLLFNVAGVAIGGTFRQASERDFDWLLDVNLGGTVRMCRAFLPLLEESTDARIVNVSSIFGIIAPPGQAAYCASKFAVRGFSQVLAHELAGTRIGVTVVHPGGVATQIADRARVPDGVAPEDTERALKAMKRSLKMPAERAGEIIVAGVEKRRARILVGSDAKFAALAERLFPVGYWGVLRRLAKATS